MFELPEIQGRLRMMYRLYNFFTEFLEIRLEPENELDKYAIAVIKNSVVVGHLINGFNILKIWL